MCGIGIGVRHLRRFAVHRDDVALDERQDRDEAECNEDDVAAFVCQTGVVFVARLSRYSEILPIALRHVD